MGLSLSKCADVEDDIAGGENTHQSKGVEDEVSKIHGVLPWVVVGAAAPV